MCKRYKIKGDDVVLEKFSYKYIAAPLLTAAKQYYVSFLYDKLFSHCVDKRNVTNKRVLLLKNMLEASRREINKKFGENTKFIVFRYDRGIAEPYHWVFEKMKEKNIDVISLKELSSIDFFVSEYQIEDNYHPNEKEWDIITPLIFEYIKNSRYIE